MRWCQLRRPPRKRASTRTRRPCVLGTSPLRMWSSKPARRCAGSWCCACCCACGWGLGSGMPPSSISQRRRRRDGARPGCYRPAQASGSCVRNGNSCPTNAAWIRPGAETRVRDGGCVVAAAKLPSTAPPRAYQKRHRLTAACPVCWVASPIYGASRPIAADLVRLLLLGVGWSGPSGS